VIVTTWICQICREERPDKRISVLSYPMKDFPNATINTKYCNDNPKCWEGAQVKKEKGEM